MELEAQVEAMKATISDLEAEAKFFESTAAEASVRLLSHCHVIYGQWLTSVLLIEGDHSISLLLGHWEVEKKEK